MEIQKSQTGKDYTLTLDGRLDTNTCGALQEEILKVFEEGCEHLILDFSGLAYLSSAGLRVLLIGQKTAAAKGATMVLTHVNEEVTDILQMTGFYDILTIQ